MSTFEKFDPSAIPASPASPSFSNSRNSTNSRDTDSNSRFVHGIPLPELRKLAGDDWPEIEADPDLLEAVAHAVRTRRMRELGEIPPEYTQSVECAGCGPVLLWKGAPDRIEACPWCFNRIRGLPVPKAAP